MTEQETAKLSSKLEDAIIEVFIFRTVAIVLVTALVLLTYLEEQRRIGQNKSEAVLRREIDKLTMERDTAFWLRQCK